jgi:hypothetical protein
MALAQPLVSFEELSQLAGRVRPQAPAHERTLAVREDLAGLLPGGGLRRGSMTTVNSRALLHALIAEPSQSGSWVAFVGMESLGLAAAAEVGVVLDRVVVIDTGYGSAPREGAVRELPPEVIAALVDAVDVVVLGPRAGISPRSCRRLEARARERGAVVLIEGPWPGTTDLDIEVLRREPVGVGNGHGHLVGIRSEVAVVGRGSASQRRKGWIWLQGSDHGPFAATEADTPETGAEPALIGTEALIGADASVGSEQPRLRAVAAAG